MGQHDNDGTGSYDIPIEVVRGEIQKMRVEMAEAGDLFMGLMNRFEACAKNVRDCSMQADRRMFQPFFDAIFRHPCIQILGSKDERQVYEVTGIDGGGIYIKRYGDMSGKEFHIDVMSRLDMAQRIRRARPPEYTRPPANYAPMPQSPSYAPPSAPPQMPPVDVSDIPPSEPSPSSSPDESPSGEPSA